MRKMFICIIFSLTFFTSQIWSQEIELLYSKPQPNYYYTSPTSKHIAIFGYNRIILLDAKSGNIIFAKPLTKLSSAESIVFFVTIIDSINKIIIGHKNGKTGKGLNLEEFNYVTGEVLRSERLLQDKEIIGGEISPDCKYLATIDKDYDAKIFDFNSGELILDIKSAIDSNFLVYDLKFSKDSKLIALLGGTKIYLYDIHQKAITSEINSVSYPSHRISISNFNKYIFKYYYEKNVDVFEVASGNKVFTLNHPGRVYDVFVEGNDEILYTKTYDNAYIWSLVNGILLDSLPQIGNFPLRKLKLENEDYFVIGSGEKISLMNRTNKEVKVLCYGIQFPKFIDGGKYFIAGSPKFKIFSSFTGDLINSLNNPKLFEVSDLSNIGYYFQNDTLYWLDVYSGTIQTKEFLPLEKYLSYFSFSNDFAFFTYYDSSKSLRIYDWATKKLQMIIENPKGFTYKRHQYRMCLFSKNSNFLAVLTSDTADLMKFTLRVYNIKNLQIVFEITMQTGTIVSFTFSYDEKYFFFRNGESPIYQVDLRNGQLLNSFEVPYIEGSTHTHRFLSFPNTSWLVLSSNKSAKIIILDYEKSEVVAILDDTNIGLAPTGLNTLYSFDVSNDGQFLIAQYEDAVVMRRIMKFASTENNIPRNENKSNISIKLSDGTLEILSNTSEFKCNSIQIFDYLGRKIYSMNIDKCTTSPFTFQIDLRHFVSGIYFVAISSDNSIEPYSFIVIK